MIPAPPFNSFQIGPVTLHIYGLIIALAVISCYKIALTLAKSKSISEQLFEKYFLIILPLAILGARAYHVLANWYYYKDNLIQILAIWSGGLGIYGAVVTILIAIYVLAKKDNIEWRILTDIIAVVIPLGQAIGRWGNYVNQEIFGLPTTLPWGLYVDTQFRPEQFARFNTFHPTFLYESLLNIGNFSVLYFLYRKKQLAPGIVTGIYLVLYGITRFLVDIIKIDPDAKLITNFISVGQWASLISISAGLLCVNFSRKNYTSTPK